MKNKDKSNFIIFVIVALLTLSVVGCSKQQETAVPTAVSTAPLPTRDVATLEVVDDSPKCVNSFVYIDDANYVDGTVVTPGESFLKEWEVQNTGSCDWTQDYKLRFVGGNLMGLNDTLDVPSVPVGGKGKISVEMTAPTEPGSYRSEWMIFGSDNRFFGELLYVEIVVQ